MQAFGSFLSAFVLAKGASVAAWRDCSMAAGGFLLQTISASAGLVAEVVGGDVAGAVVFLVGASVLFLVPQLCVRACVRASGAAIREDGASFLPAVGGGRCFAVASSSGWRGRAPQRQRLASSCRARIFGTRTTAQLQSASGRKTYPKGSTIAGIP
eukprot:GHVT01009703.1.p1 GENE.GHVT01009703.1~~GHVT01009703.1.p1  ORF type:complete len:156 (-),score=17.88 GHVT01009703.1:1891-2358(-)